MPRCAGRAADVAKMKIKWNRNGFRELRTDPAVQANIVERAERIADACGPGFEVRASTPRNRARAVVLTTEPAAMVRNARDHTLLTNIDKGR